MKIFQREQRSLFGEILDWMLTPLLLLWPVSLALTWLVAQGLANKPFDRALEYNAHALAQLVSVQKDGEKGEKGGEVQFNLPQPASEILRADDSDIVYYQVMGPGGEFLSGERELPEPAPEVVLDQAVERGDLGVFLRRQAATRPGDAPGPEALEPRARALVRECIHGAKPTGGNWPWERVPTKRRKTGPKRRYICLKRCE